MKQTRLLNRIFLSILCVSINTIANAKYLSGVTKIEKMYLLIEVDRDVDKEKVSDKINKIFEDKIAGIELIEFNKFKKSSDELENMILFVNITMLESSKRSGKGAAYVLYIDIKAGNDGFDDIGSFKKIYWAGGIMMAITHKNMVTSEIRAGIEKVLNEFVAEWNETKELFE